MSQTILLKVHNATKTVAEHTVVTKDGQPTVIKAQSRVNYELLNPARGTAPDHIVTKRVGKDLHISLEKEGKESDIIIEDYYDNPNSAIIGIAEDGQYYYYIPDTGEVVDYVTELALGDIEGQALGGHPYAAPWWMGATTEGGILPWLVGLAVVGGIAALVGSKGDGEDGTAPKLEDPADTPVVDLTNLTPEEKQAVKDAVKAANPTLNLTDDQITVGNDGAVTVQVPGKDAATLPKEQTVAQKPDTSAPALEDPADTPVVDLTNLTPEEKQAVKDAVKAANPTLNLTDDQITVGNDGAVTVQVPGKDAATLPKEQTVAQKPDTSAPALEDPADTPVVDLTNLTPEEKQAVKDAVKAANPTLNLTDDQITVGNDGAVTVQVPGKDAATLPKEQTVAQKPDTSAPALEDPADTPVVDLTNLTPEEKQAVKDAVKAANPTLNLTDDQITVGNDGAVTVQVPGKDAATLPKEQTVAQKPDTSAPALEDPADTPVVDLTNLTPEEKQAVKDAVKAANPTLNLTDDQITVGNDGAVTVQVPGKDAATLPKEQTVAQKPDTSAPALEDPADTPVVDLTNLTPEEKQAVKDAVKAANPTLNLTDDQITVGNDGAVTVQVPGKDAATLPKEQTVAQKPDTSAPALEDPADTPVVDLTNLTPEEKQAVKDAVKAANPTLNLTDDQITVGNDGAVTVQVPGKDAATLPKEQTVAQKPDTSAPALEDPADTPVVDLTNLTPEEKQAVKDAVKAANPTLNLTDDQITVGNDGAVTVQVPGKDAATLPKEQTVAQKPDTSAPALEDPADTPVVDLTNLTPEEKQAVKDAVKAANPTLNLTDDQITVGNDGAVTVQVPGKDAATLPKEQTVAQKPDTSAPALEDPADTPVVDLTNLTPEEKQAVKDAVKAANPTLNLTDDQITVGNDGAVTVQVPGKDAATLPKEQTVAQKPDTSAPALEDPADTPVVDLTNLTPEEKQAVKDAVKAANPTLNLTDDQITVGNDGAVTVQVPGKDAATLPKEQTVAQKPDTSAPALEDPADTPVVDLTNLTPEEKQAVKDAVKAANPTLNLTDDQITVGNDGAVTVQVPGKDAATLPKEQTVAQKPDTSAPALEDPADTPVVDLTNLTPEEKQAVKDAVKAANPTLNLTDDQITVGNDGAVTVQVPGKDAATLPKEQTVAQKPDTSAPALEDPADTPVVDLTNLTPEEKQAVKDAVKAANPTLNLTDDQITVGNDGAVTVQVPGKDAATLPKEQTVAQKPDTSAPALEDPADTPVVDLTNLTPEEKQAVKDAVKAANPTLNLTDDQITVGNDGAVTVQVPGKDAATLPKEQTVAQKPDTSAPALEDPADTPVVDLTNLTPEEKQAVKDAVKAANPTLNLTDDQITVGNDGAVTVQVPGKDAATLPKEQTVAAIPPVTPTTAPNLTDASDTGVSNSDDKTADNTPSFTIPAPAAGETPVLFVNGVEVPSTFDPNTNTITPNSPLADGPQTITTATRKGTETSEKGPELAIIVDTTPPVIQTAEVPANGDELVLTYNEALDPDNPPALDKFTVTVGGQPVTPTAVTVNGDKVTLTLPNDAVKQGQPVTVTYNDPTTNNDPAATQDVAGNDAPTETPAVTNNSEVEDTPTPQPPVAGKTVTDVNMVVPTNDVRFGDIKLTFGQVADSSGTITRANDGSSITWGIRQRPAGLSFKNPGESSGNDLDNINAATLVHTNVATPSTTNMRQTNLNLEASISVNGKTATFTVKDVGTIYMLETPAAVAGDDDFFIFVPATNSITIDGKQYNLSMISTDPAANAQNRTAVEAAIQNRNMSASLVPNGLRNLSEADKAKAVYERSPESGGANDVPLAFKLDPVSPDAAKPVDVPAPYTGKVADDAAAWTAGTGTGVTITSKGGNTFAVNKNGVEIGEFAGQATGDYTFTPKAGIKGIDGNETLVATFNKGDHTVNLNLTGKFSDTVAAGEDLVDSIYTVKADSDKNIDFKLIGDVEMIDLSLVADATLQNVTKDQVTASQNNELYIRGGSDDTVVLGDVLQAAATVQTDGAGSWTKGAAKNGSTVDGDTKVYDTWTNDGTTLYIEQGITVI